MNDPEIYKKAAQVLKKGENIALITVISTSGSTPGKVGYKMLVWGKKGEAIGTVGGGLTEAEMINTAKNILPKTQNQVFRFDLDGTEYDGKPLCGGSIEFLIETFDKKGLPLFKKLSTAVENGGKGALISIISPKESHDKFFLTNIDGINTATDINFSSEEIESIRKLVAKEQSAKITLADVREIFIETISEQPMVFIFGAGHLSYYISRYAKSLNFRVTVCDDRAEFANKERFPDADNIIVEGFKSVFDKIDIDHNSYIVIVTKGHKLDEIVLEKAVRTKAKYIGMIGSKRKTLTILKRLDERGIPEETLRRVYSPIGISIGAVTPEEIALSIVCELIKIRRLGNISKTNHMKINFSKKLLRENL
ncbi:MAG: XdhC family protein [Planctomycetota bacterium]|jgi:xanthine dehydrogenase accessory factor